MKPDFNPEEEYILSYYRDETVSSPNRALALDVTRLVVAGGLFVMGFHGQDPLWMLIGFGILAVHEIRTGLQLRRYTLIYRSIFNKYRDHCEALEAALHADSNPKAP